MNWNWDSVGRKMVAQSIYMNDGVPLAHSFKVNTKFDVAKPFILTSNEELLPKALSKRSFATMSALMKYVANFEEEAAADIAANAASTTADNSTRDTVEEDVAVSDHHNLNGMYQHAATSTGFFRKLWNKFISNITGVN